MPIQLPSYAKTSFILISLSIILALLYLGQHIFIPVLLSALLAILLIPIVNFFNKRLKFPHVIAILTSVVLFILFISGIVFFVSWQVSGIADDWNKIKHNLFLHYENIQQWVMETFRISYTSQEKYIQRATEDSLNKGGKFLGNTLNSFKSIVLNTVLIPVYTFLFLLYRKLFVKFLTQLVADGQHKTLGEILVKIRSAIQHFLTGLLLEMGIVATLTTTGLMIIGVEYALLLGSITGILNMIPYIGILIAGLLTIITTLSTSSGLSIVLGVIIVNSIVQLIDNNLLIPLIMSSSVRINAIASIIGIFVGGTIAGVAGMFLAIPMIAILKVIFDHIEAYTPWGLLMGEDKPHRPFRWRKRKLNFLKKSTSHERNDNTNGTA